jgi:hypothetical protein
MGFYLIRILLHFCPLPINEAAVLSHQLPVYPTARNPMKQHQEVDVKMLTRSPCAFWKSASGCKSLGLPVVLNHVPRRPYVSIFPIANILTGSSFACNSKAALSAKCQAHKAGLQQGPHSNNNPLPLLCVAATRIRVHGKCDPSNMKGTFPY